MSSISSILNINLDVIRDFPLLADRVADHQTERMVNKNVKRLKEIEERMFVEKGIEVSRQSIDEVFQKLKRLLAKEDLSLENWSVRELRIISYYLGKIHNKEKELQFALLLLDEGWRNMFFNGLVFLLLNSWHTIERECREAVGELVMRKLQEYKDNNKRYKRLRNHANLFDKSGPIRMAAILSAKEIELTDAPTILGYKSTTFNQSYYSDVMLKYIKDNRVTDIRIIETLLQYHNLDRTKKLLFAYLVETEERYGDAITRMDLCRLINRTLGDVTISSTWAPFAGASNDEAQRLRKAKELVNIWFAQQIIEVFFEVCVQDWDRKTFWTKYVKYLSGFKIVGGTSIKRLLQNDRRIGSMVFRHFIETNSITSQTSALVLFMRNKMIVEFSDVGALYVYNHDHAQVKLVTTKRQFQINSTNDLKVPSIGLLIEQNEWGGYYFYNEGRVTHRGAWQDRMSSWLDKKVLSKDVLSVSFFNTKDDELFKATPLENEQEEVKHNEDISPKTNIVTPKASQYIKSPSAEQVQPNLNKKEEEQPKYSTNIVSRINSKWVDEIKVVANEWGFYLHKAGSENFARLKKLNIGERPIGAIWIKRPNNSGWREISHFYSGVEITVGYFKVGNGGNVQYKETYDSTNIKHFKF